MGPSSELPKTAHTIDRKSTRLNSSHVEMSYAVFCLKKKIRTIMFMLFSWFGLTLPLLNAADWFRLFRLLKRLFVSSLLSEVIYVWCYFWRYGFCSCWCRHV